MKGSIWTRRTLSLLLALAVVLSLLPAAAVAAPAADGEKVYRLWYDEPAAETNSGFESQSLPLGNGYMGVNVFGGTEHELLSVTENSMSNGYGTGSTTGPDGDSRPSSNREGLNLLAKTYIDFGHKDVTNYTRELVLNDAVARVQYDYNGVTYTREYFTTYPDKVLVMKLSASEPGALTFTLRPTAPFVRDYLTTPGDGKGKTGKVVADTETNDLLTLSGTMNYFNINYEGQYKVIPTGGDMVAANDENGENGTITVTGADSAVILMAVGTNYHMTPEVFTAPNSEKLDPNEYPHDKVSGYIADAAAKGYENLKSAHLSDYQSYFDRAQLDLGGVPSDTVTTDQLLANYKNGKYDKYLEELVFQYGRYLLIASSREGCLPAHLQGIWNFYESTPWSGGYWHNINQQMNYWPAFNTNLIDLFEPYADFNEAFRQAAEANADQYLAAIKSPYLAEAGTGENGWAIGTGVWPYRAEAPSSTGHSGPGTGAFTSILFWDYYDFTRDETILAEHTYPAIEGMAKFLTKTLKEYEDGKWLVYNSASPENANNYRTVGCAFDQQMVYENHKDVLLAAELLGLEDNELLTTIRSQIDHLDPVNIGYSGQIKEYREEKYYGEIGEYQHRHISQLVGLYPGTSITSDTDAWMDAAKITLNYRGDGSTGWSICHRLNAWARTKDGNHSYQVLQKLLKTKLMNNLWDTHPPFQIDGNFGATAGIGEMLLQGHEGYLAPLPALPDAWATGSYQGLTARGAFEVSAWWQDGQATKFTVKSNAGEDCAIQYYNLADATVTDSKGNPVTFTELSQDRISFPTVEGETYTITNIPAYEETAAPSDFQLDNSGNGMELSWTASADAVSYNIYRAVNDAPTYELVAEDVKETHYTYLPDDLKDQDRVTMRVTAVAENGRESVGVTALSNPLEAPENVTGFFTGTSLQINVPDDSGVDSFCVYQDGKAVVTTAYSVIVIPNADPDAVYTISAISNGRESEPVEVNVTDQAELENILLNKPLSVSGATVNQSYPLSNAVDGKADPTDANDRWAVYDQYGAYSVTADLQGTYPLGTLQILEWKSDTPPTRSPSTKVEVLNAEGTWQTIQEGFALKGGEYVSVDMGGVEASKIRITFDNLDQFKKSVCITEMTCSSILPDPVDKAGLFDALQQYGSVDVDGKVIDSAVRAYTAARTAAEDALLNLNADAQTVSAAETALREAAENVTALKENVLLNQSISTHVSSLSSFPAKYMVDGDPATRFAASDNGNNIIATVDLKANYTFDAFYVQEYLNIGTETRGQQVTIEVYQDGQWITVVSGTKLTSTPDQERDTHATTEFKLDEPVTGSQVRFTFVNTENKRITIYELQASGEKVVAHTHEMTHTPEKAATCTEEGNTEYWYCAGCDKYFSDAEGTTEITKESTVIPVTDHTPVTVAGKDPTCTEPGLTEGSQCSVCGTVLVKQEEIPATGHSWTETYEKENADAEKHYHVCTVCGAKDEGEAHSWNAEAATEENDKHCTVCGYVAEAQLEHTHEGVLVEGKEPTCTENGAKDYYECRCGKYFEDAECTEEITDLSSWKVIPATGHTAEVLPAEEPTCTETGLTEGSQCSVCGEILKAQEEIPALGHDFTIWAYNADQHWKTCSRCGAEDETSREAHKWVEDEERSGEKTVWYTCECGAEKSEGRVTATPTYILKAEQSEGGKISPESKAVSRGGELTFAITPDAGYRIADVLVDGKSVGAVSEYTFKNVSGHHTITAEFTNGTAPVETVKGFTDVTVNDWFADAVEYAVDEGLMNGTSATTFSPKGDTTRGMIVTILYRLAGSLEVESDGATWWSDARVWAMEEGISDGTNMEGKITREQLAAMLYRYAGSPEVKGDLSAFADAESVSDWATDALIWATANEIVTGKTGGILDPQAGATRAETAAMLMRYGQLDQ